MEAYLDNSATTRVSAAVRDVIVKTMTEDYGNPSSKHRKGIEGEQYIRKAKEEIAKTLKVETKEILFTSGGTESNNMAIIGAAMANKRAGMHLITSAVEHPSVYNSMEFLKEQGFRVTYIPVDSKGVIQAEELEKAVCEDTILVSVMYVNNEIGAVMPIEEIGERIKKKNPNTLFHVDAIQAYGKYRIYPKKSKIDLMSVSGHKFHGPKGVGFLYIKDKTKIKPFIYGGGQQKGMRSGTENVPGVAGLGCAAKEAYTDFDEKIERLYQIKEMFTDGIEKMDKVRVNGPKRREGAPQIVSVSFEGIKSEVLLHALEERGVYVSSGSACSSNKPGISGTLKAIGLDKKLLDSTIRFSFNADTSEAEINYCLKCLEEIVPILRRYVKM
jgi:cysteine desulfurase